MTNSEECLTDSEGFLTDEFLDRLYLDVQNSAAEGAAEGATEDLCVPPPDAPSTTVVAVPKTTTTEGAATVFAALRRYECLYFGCGKRFNRSEHLKKHIEAVHHKKKPVQCQECPKAFATAAALKVHTRVHTGEKPFACLYPGCERRFSQKMHRDRHTRVHTGKKPYVCGVCKRKFSQRSSMKRHINIVHNTLLGV